MLDLQKIKSVMLGHAIGDALGVPVEFSDPKELEEHPVNDMEGYGSFPVPAGSWSDDTSMALATLDSLCKGVVDLKDIMKNFGKWFYVDDFTPTGKTFDVGNTCARAILNFFERKQTIEECGLRDENSNGNGSLMRIHPVALYLYTKEDLSIDEKLNIIYDVSALTHAHERSKVACGIYAFILWGILDSTERDLKKCVRKALIKACKYYKNSPERKYYYRLFLRMEAEICTRYETKPLTLSEIKSSGYVVDTIEAAVFCLLHTSSYSNCVLAAVNLGHDTDTVGAIAGGLAGAFYGMESLPEGWLTTLKRREYIEDMCERAYAVWCK